MKSSKRFWTGSLILMSLVLCFKGNLDSDLFWHMATGRWILENGTFPSQDMFSYVYTGAEWINLPWIFQIGTALSMQLFDYTGVLLFCSIFFIASLVLSWGTYERLSKTSTSLPLWLLATAVLFVLERRWVARPEVFTHIFLALEIFILVSFCLDPQKK